MVFQRILGIGLLCGFLSASYFFDEEKEPIEQSVSVGSDMSTQSKEGMNTHTISKIKPDLKVTEKIPAKGEDYTAHVFLQVHGTAHETNNIDGKLRKEAVNCQYEMFMELEKLLDENKISAVFYEGLPKGESIEEFLRKKGLDASGWMSRSEMSDEMVYYFMHEFPGFGAMILPLLRDDTSVLFSGWEGDIDGLLEANTVMSKFKASSQEYEKKRREGNLTVEDIISRRSSANEYIREMSRLNDRVFANRTLMAYDNSIEQGKQWMEKHPNNPRGIAFTLGLRHKYVAGRYGSISEYIRGLESHPVIVVHECKFSPDVEEFMKIQKKYFE